MDPIRNPFSPSAGSRPPELAGRETILTDAKVALARILKGRSAQSLMLLGLRGTGKTVLLNEIQAHAEELNYLTAMMEAPEDNRLAEMLYPDMLQALRQFSTVEAAKATAHQALGALRNFASVFKISAGGVEISVEPTTGTADSGHLDRDLTEMFELIGKAAQAAGRGWALLIDEVQYLNEDELAALITAVHRVNQRGLPVIVIAAGLPQMAKLAGDAKSYAERLFNYPPVGALDRPDAEAAIRNPLLEEDVRIDDNALELMIEQTSGYPFFLQEWGYQAWDIADASPIALSDVKAASERALQRLDNGFFRVRTDRLTPGEIDYVQAMADLGTGPYRAADVAEQLGRSQQSSLSPTRASIIQKGMIYSPSRGEVDFTVPLFDEYLRRQDLTGN